MVGSIIPSSAVLARSLCKHAHGAEHIIELGAGTGVITQQLGANFPLIPLVVTERDNRMATALHARFSRPAIVAANVEDCAHLFQELPAASVVISSLPFRSLPLAVSDKIIRLLTTFLCAAPQRRLAQFSYGRRVPFPSPAASLVWTRDELVLRNVPPAWVWTLQQTKIGTTNNVKKMSNTKIAKVRSC
jgi:phosphatidylethanolamine/phosphatidyl-N-methylethanolamine N-methyltransferase